MGLSSRGVPWMALAQITLLVAAVAHAQDVGCQYTGCENGLICVDSDGGCYSVDDLERAMYEEDSQPQLYTRSESNDVPEYEFYNGPGLEAYDYANDYSDRQPLTRLTRSSDGVQYGDYDPDEDIVSNVEVLADNAGDTVDDILGDQADVDRVIENQEKDLNKVENEIEKDVPTSVVAFLAQNISYSVLTSELAAAAIIAGIDGLEDIQNVSIGNNRLRFTLQPNNAGVTANEIVAILNQRLPDQFKAVVSIGENDDSESIKWPVVQKVVDAAKRNFADKPADELTAREKNDAVMQKVMALGKEEMFDDSDQPNEGFAKRMQRKVRAIISNSHLRATSDQVFGITKSKYIMYAAIGLAGTTILILSVVGIVTVRKYRRTRAAQESLEQMFQDPFQPQQKPMNHGAIKTNDDKIVEALDRSHSAKNSLTSQASKSPSPDEVADNVISWEDQTPTNMSTVQAVASKSVVFDENGEKVELSKETCNKVLDYLKTYKGDALKFQKDWAVAQQHTGKISVAAQQHKDQNRANSCVPYDHNRVKLVDTGSGYINASRVEVAGSSYLVTQGPLESTVVHFWRMIWQENSSVIVMLSPLIEDGRVASTRYWPDEGSLKLDGFEVHLVSEHVWSDHFLVRTLYIRNTKTGKTRTITQLHYLSWPRLGVPSSVKDILEFRRKINRIANKNSKKPIVVHCDVGGARSSIYCLIDSSLRLVERTRKGDDLNVKQNLQKIGEQRMKSVDNVEQYRFAVDSIIGEVNGYL